jgi:hypothetical protein
MSGKHGRVLYQRLKFDREVPLVNLRASLHTAKQSTLPAARQLSTLRTIAPM